MEEEPWYYNLNITVSVNKTIGSSSVLLITLPLILSAFTHLWNPIGFPNVYTDEGHYLRRVMQMLDGLGFQESRSTYSTPYDHPYFGQIFLAGLLALVGYPDSLNPRPGDPYSIEMLYLMPRLLMGLLAILDTFLIYKIAERRYSSKLAFIAAILFAVMPMTWMLRRVLLDSILLPFLLSSILFAVYSSTASRSHREEGTGAKGKVSDTKYISIILSGIFLGIAIFTKTPVFVMIPLVAYLIYKNSNARNKKGKLKTLGLWFIPVILIPAIWPIFAIASGQFDDWKTGVFDQTARNNDGLARIMGYFFKYDPTLLIVGAIGLVYAVIRKDMITLTWVIPFLLFLYFLNYGTYFYVIPVLPAFCIAAARLVIDVPEKIQGKIPASFIRNVTKRVVGNSSKKIQPTMASYIMEGNDDNNNKIKGEQGYAQKSRFGTSRKFRSTSWFGFSYASIFIIGIVAGIGIIATTFLIPIDASWAQIQAAAFAGTYIEERKGDNLTLVSSPVYSWISYYVFDNYQALKSFTNVPQGEVVYDNVLILADNHMRTSMKKENAENLWSLYNDTSLVAEFSGRANDYDTRDYPYTNLLNMKEGAFIEIKGGSDVNLGQGDKNLRSNTGVQIGEVSGSYVEEDDNLLMHIHAQLKVSKDGQPMVIPANIGIDPMLHKDNTLEIYGQQKSPLHTHTDAGTIHVESKIITNYTLGEFLDVWGIDLNGKAIKTMAEGEVVPNYRGHVLRDGEHIDLIICSEVNTLESSAC
jgi:4-amino-4-deoxy-L-arabinose transferase-like glycosyltransferase